MSEEGEYLTATQARDLLGVSQGKMTALIREGQLPTYPDPLNKRIKLIKKSDVDALLAQSASQRKPEQIKGRVRETKKHKWRPDREPGATCAYNNPSYLQGV